MDRLSNGSGVSREVHAPFYEGLAGKSAGLLTKKVERSDKVSIEAAADSAILQIEEKGYAKELLDRGTRRILYLGFAFKGKKVSISHKFRSE